MADKAEELAREICRSINLGSCEQLQVQLAGCDAAGQLELLTHALREIAAMPLGDHRTNYMAEAVLKRVTATTEQPEGAEWKPDSMHANAAPFLAGEGMSAEQFKTVTDHKFIAQECHQKGCQYLVLAAASEGIKQTREATQRSESQLRALQDEIEKRGKAEAELAELREERDALKELEMDTSLDLNAQLRQALQERDAFDSEARDLLGRAERAESALAEARAALERYGNHEIVDGVKFCAAFNDQSCTCGFDAALLALKEKR